MRTIRIYVERDGVKFYLMADGNLSASVADAAHHWESQFPHIVADQSSFLSGAKMELVNNVCVNNPNSLVDTSSELRDFVQIAPNEDNWLDGRGNMFT